MRVHPRRSRPASWPAQKTLTSGKMLPKVINFSFFAFGRTRPKVPLPALEAWTRQLAHVLQAGIPLSKALRLLEQTRKISAVSPLSGYVYEQIVQGCSFGEALNAYPGISPAFVQLVKAGEQSGTLALQMQRLADQLARQLAWRRQIISALAYPMTVLSVSTGVVIALLWWVVPTMAELFVDMGTPLPAATLAVMGMSQWLQHSGPGVTLGLAVLALMGAGTYWRWPRLRWYADRALLQLPVWGRMRRLHQQSQWSYSLATLLAAGVPMVESLQSCAQGCRPVLAHETEKVRQHIVQGSSLSHALENGHGFDHLLIEMARVGEESGLLGPMLLKAAQTQEADLSASVSRLTTLVEPIMVLLLGVVIGGVVLAMYLPMFQMGQLF